MTEPRKPGEGEPDAYSLPSWIDQAIARSKGEPPPPVSDPAAERETHADAEGLEALEETDQHFEPVSEDEPTAEYPAMDARSAPPRPVSESPSVDVEVVPHFLGATEERHVSYPNVPEPHTVKVEKEVHPELGAVVPATETRRGSALPWLFAALFLMAAALVLAYLIWIRPINA